MARRILAKNFFNRPVLIVAKELLGKFLICRLNNKNVSLMITEVEAYDGPSDKASHASKGKTERNEVMFAEAGKFYIYFTYGMHWMLNIVTGPKDYPAAVLIRETDKITGPARITKFLKIDKKFNGKPAVKKTGLWVEDRNIKIKPFQIERGKRIGVDYAGKWADKLYRFKIVLTF